ncbi:MAG: amidohydrolase family protein [Verrucomicrobiota bacterium]|nr:amidohydrolase family protein [Verrucomicrobiota bacterium]
MNPSTTDRKRSVRDFSRREFLATSGIGLAGIAFTGCTTPPAPPAPIIDIHQHVNYSNRPDDVLLHHQRAMGVTTTILLPAGRAMKNAATHDGDSNGLEAKAFGNEACYQFARAHRKEFLCAANEVPDFEGAAGEIERYLKLGAVMIAEQKFGLECDAPAMQKLYALAQAYNVPVLMHWQFQRYNYGFERFNRMLEKYPHVNFIGHAQTWWANVDQNHRDQTVLYPKGPVTPGGLTERYLADYPNMFGDLSAGSGLNALTRDESFTPGFFQRHQDKLMYGSDCNDHAGEGPQCQGAETIAAVRRFAPKHAIERKLLHGNAKRLFRL